MFPLRDLNPTRRVPYVTYALIAINIAMFVYMYIDLTPTQTQAFVHQHGVIPYYLLSGYGPALSTPITSLFMHGSLGHLMGNMWYLHVFGDNVEDALGRGRYIAFYFVTGIVAVLAHVLIQPSNQLPLVGASGAISGVLGAYVLLYPRAKVLTFLIFFFELPSFIFILFWFGLQVLAGYGSLSSTETTSVAFFAHLGGFLAGLAFVALGGKPKKRGPVTYLGPQVPTRELRRR